MMRRCLLGQADLIGDFAHGARLGTDHSEDRTPVPIGQRAQRKIQICSF